MSPTRSAGPLPPAAQLPARPGRERSARRQRRPGRYRQRSARSPRYEGGGSSMTSAGSGIPCRIVKDCWCELLRSSPCPIYSGRARVSGPSDTRFRHPARFAAGVKPPTRPDSRSGLQRHFVILHPTGANDDFEVREDGAQVAAERAARLVLRVRTCSLPTLGLGGCRR
jgi:hypothetical protein